MDDERANLPEANPVYDVKALCEEFARLKEHDIKLMKEPCRDRWFVRIRYGKYCLKYFDGAHADSPRRAWMYLAIQLCDPDRWFNPCNFKGWSHFGKCLCVEELAMRMAIYGETEKL